MTTEEFKQLEVIEARRRLRWRRVAELVHGGFESLDAFAISTDPDVNQAVDLLARGCPRETALRILL